MLEKFVWRCPRAGCDREIHSYTESSLDALANIHRRMHVEETIQNIRTFEEAKALAPPKDYNKLVINRTDLGFLKTRGILLDQDMEISYEKIIYGRKGDGKGRKP